MLDNCEDADLLAAWRPRIGGGCRVLVTSRSSAWDAALGVVAQRLGVLDRGESIALLQSLRADLTNDAAGEIARVLGDLPLALHLAGSFLRAYPQEQPDAYLKRLESALLAHPSLMGRGSRQSSTDHDRHVARTFALSYDRLDADAPCDADARRLLARTACLAPGEPIPADLLLATLGRDLADEAARLDAQDALARLVALGLIDREQGEALLLHRLLHAFVSDVADDANAQGAVERELLGTMDARVDVVHRYAPLDDILIHLRWITEQARKREDAQAATLANDLAIYLQQIGDYQAARPFYEWALVTRERVLGREHLLTASTLSNLAELFRLQGEFRAARPLYQRVMAIHERMLEVDPLLMATSLSNLAGLLLAEGEYGAARSLFARALAIHEGVVGPQHPLTAISLNNLALSYQRQGDYSAARPLYQRALAIRTQTLGPEHPQTATSLSNLAALERIEDNYDAARPLLERALAIHEGALGANHPQTAQSLNNLAALLVLQGDYATARLLYEQALAICKPILGADHPQTTSILHNLAGLVARQGDYTTACSLYEKALASCERVLGADHPQTAAILNDLAVNYADQRQFAAAAELMRRALAIRTQRLGPDHPDTQSSWQSLAAIAEHLDESTVQRVAEAQIAQIIQQAETDMAQAFADGSAQQRAALAQHLEAVAQRAEEGEADGSPWYALAAHLRILKARLESHDSPYAPA